MRDVQTDRQHLTGQVVRLLLAGCLALPGIAAAADDSKAFVGARIIDGTGKAAVEQATLLVRNVRKLSQMLPVVGYLTLQCRNPVFHR